MSIDLERSNPYIVADVYTMDEKSHRSSFITYFGVKPKKTALTEKKKNIMFDSIPAFHKDEHYLTLSDIDSITANTDEKTFKDEWEEYFESSIKLGLVYESRGVFSQTKKLIWNNSELANYIKNVVKQNKNNLLGVSRNHVESTLENGGFFLSRLVALIFEHEKEASISFGYHLIDAIIQNEKNMAFSREIDNRFPPVSKGAFTNYETIRELFYILNNKDSKRLNKQEELYERKYYLAKIVDGKYCLWDFKQEEFVPFGKEEVTKSSLLFLDSFTSRFSRVEALDNDLEEGLDLKYSYSEREPIYNIETGEAFPQKEKPEYSIVTINPENNEILECFPPLFNDYNFLDYIDSYGFYAGADSNNAIKGLIRKLADSVSYEELKSGNMPCYAFYPYISYIELRKIMNIVLKNKKEIKKEKQVI